MIRRMPLMLIVFLAGAVIQRIGFAEVRTNIVKDKYVLPVAELASTKTYPEIIEAENDYLEVEVLPNRGRVIARLVDKTSKLSFFYDNPTPKPMVLPGGLHSVEFGGYYLSLPWNTRDRQPFDLSFEIQRPDEHSAAVYLSGKDMFKKTLTECWVRLEDESPILEIEVKISNTSGKTAVKTLFEDFKVFSIAAGPDSDSRTGAPGGADDISLLLPVDSVEVVNSEKDRLKGAGAAIPYSDSLEKWGNFEGYVDIVTHQELKIPAVAVVHPAFKAAIVNFWEPEPFFDKVAVWSWGKNYTSQEGADAYFNVSCVKSELVMQPKESISFKTYFAPLSDVSAEDTLASLYERARSRLK